MRWVSAGKYSSARSWSMAVLIRRNCAACLWSASSKANPSNAHRDGRKLEIVPPTADISCTGCLWPPKSHMRRTITGRIAHAKVGRGDRTTINRPRARPTAEARTSRPRTGKPGALNAAMFATIAQASRHWRAQRAASSSNRRASSGHRPGTVLRGAGSGRAGFRRRHRPDQTRSRQGRARTGSERESLFPPSRRSRKRPEALGK